jgi:hypothetical protein
MKQRGSRGQDGYVHVPHSRTLTTGDRMLVGRLTVLTLLSLSVALGACESPRITEGAPEAEEGFPTLRGRSSVPQPLQRAPGAPEVVAGSAGARGVVGAVPVARGVSDPSAFRQAAVAARLAPVQVAASGMGAGAPRLLWQHARNTSEVHLPVYLEKEWTRVVWEMEGTNWTGGYSVLGLIAPAWRIAAAADFNGDGFADVVWENTTTGERAIWFLTAAGAWQGAFAMLPVVAPAWRIVAAADFTGDGKADLVWQDGAGSTVVWPMAGSSWGGSFSPLPLTPAEWRVAAAADFSGNGQADLVWQNATTGARAIWMMGGVTRLGFVMLPVVAPEWSIATAGDFNGDGKPDLVWQNVTTGERAIWLMNGLTWEGSFALLPSVPAEWRIAAVLSRAVVPGRSLVDRPDDFGGPQIHVMYVVPSDGEDRLLDTNGTLLRSVSSFHNWFSERSNGLAFRFDTFQGTLDITFHRLSRTDEAMIAFGAFVVTEIERELRAAGRMHPNKLYIVYYDGGSTYSCGGAAWPPLVPGQTAAMYLKGTPGGHSCGAQQFVTEPTQFPRYWEFAMLHDLVHTLGIVAAHAPNHTAAYPAHVPERNDLMYGGASYWIIDASTTIDVGGDDYFGPGVPSGVTRLEDSPFVTMMQSGWLPRLRPLSARASIELMDAFQKLPPHPPFPHAR